ncbi:MAG: hypothetical protein LBE37_20740 [Sphingobacterium sp.]|nr:hypothetical protein [Sphingobacterium sp.]
MRTFISICMLCLSVFTLHAQHRLVEEDIFGNLEFRARDNAYKATLEKNIFDDLIFSDSKNNKIEFGNKYLQSQYPGILKDKNRQVDMLMGLVRENRSKSSYSAKFNVDIFDNLIIEDNKGYKLERGRDIFGNEKVEERINGEKASFKRNLNGGLEYSRGRDNASLTKDIFDRWTYKDSFGNDIQFGKQTWTRIMEQYRSDESFFRQLLDDYFY